jgi:hypothetical protein
MGGGSAKIYGIAYLFNNPDNVLTPSGDFHGTPAIYGGLVSDVGGNNMQGSYSIVYEKTLFDNLTADTSKNFDISFGGTSNIIPFRRHFFFLIQLVVVLI